MKRAVSIVKPLIVFLSAFLLFGCVTTGSKFFTKGYKYPRMYQNPPQTILVLPPTNTSKEFLAPDYFVSAIQEQLTLHGYYVVPYEVSEELLRIEGLDNPASLKNTPLPAFKEHYGADAVLFTRLRKWDIQSSLLDTSLIISFRCRLMSTESSRRIWQYNGKVSIDLTGTMAGGGLSGIISKALSKTVADVVIDYMPHTKTAIKTAMMFMPYGTYHQQHNKDQSDPVDDSVIQYVEDSSDDDE